MNINYQKQSVNSILANNFSEKVDMENDFKYCVDLVIQFIKILGSNDLERGWKNLKTFNFWELYQESDSVLTKYNLVDISSRCLIDKEKKKLFGTGLCKLEDYDPDNSKIMNAIYYLLYNSDTFHLSFLDIGNNYINNLKHRNVYRG